MFSTWGQNRGYLNPKRGVVEPRLGRSRFAFGGDAVRREGDRGCGGIDKVQVKTASDAAKNMYGETGFNWDVGAAAAGKDSPNLWYAFVDLKGSGEGSIPDVYFVPSRWVGMFVEKTWSRKLFYLKTAVAEKVANNWDMVERFLNGDKEAQKWANSLDPDFRWWGTKDGMTSAELEEALQSGQYSLDEDNCLQRIK